MPARSIADTFSSADGGFTFSYPQSWQVSEADGKIKITASDGAIYLLNRDSLTTLPTGSPVNDPGAKQASAKIAQPLAANSAFVRATSVSMDHGLGASFRYKTASGSAIDVWIGVIGKHSVVLTPAKVGQASQTIGISVVFQSMAFTDSLPRQPIPPTPGSDKAQPAQSSSSNIGSTTHTISFTSQLAPILMQRCVNCHSTDSPSGGLDVSTFNSLLAGGTHGVLIFPGNPMRSALIDYLTGRKDQMPKGSAPLSQDQIELFRQWIREGAVYSTRSSASGNVPAASSGSLAPGSRSTVARTVSGQAMPMESYTGHLASNDSSFQLRLYTNQTATADWAFDNPTPARFAGNYTSTAGVYTIQMNLVSGSIPGGSKSVKIVMQSTGSDVLGNFMLADNPGKFKITGLQLSEIGMASKKNNGVGRSVNRNKKQKGRSTAAILRRQQRQMASAVRKAEKKALKRSKHPIP